MPDEQQQHISATRRLVNKLTVKSILGEKPDIERLIKYCDEQKDEKAILFLVGILGIASDYKPGQTTLPDGKVQQWLKLLGQFRATNLETGEVFVSGVCILPGAGNDLVYGALKALEGDGAGGTVEFAFRIGIQRDKTAATGYVYVIEQTYQPAKADALDALQTKLMGAATAPAALENKAPTHSHSHEEAKAPPTGKKK